VIHEGHSASRTRRGATAGDDLARRIEDHLPLVRTIVSQVSSTFPRYVDREELARAGALGLVEAARRYDGSRGVPFGRFATRRIRGAVLDAVRAADWAPRSVRNLARRLDEVEQRLTGQLGRTPFAAELADALGIGAGTLTGLQAHLSRVVLLNLEHDVADASEELSLLDVLHDRSRREPLEELEWRELLTYVRDAVVLLPERHRSVIVGYFLEDRTSRQLADDLGVSESRVSQLRAAGLRMLREGIAAQYRTDGSTGATGERPVAQSDVRPPKAPGGRLVQRKMCYASAIRQASGWRARLDRMNPPTSLAG
jgi:RNA polymerase sigma factor for flagellar operon FliA